MNSIGINLSSLDMESIYVIGYSNTTFKIRDKFYIIKEIIDDKNQINSLITLFKNDEFKGSGNGVFTYVIGTEYNIDLNEKTIKKNELLNICDINKMHLWCKHSSTIQEIETKHAHILKNLKNNFDNIFNELNKYGNVDPTLLHDNSIDQLYYAGEMKYDSNKNELYINFLSGTFMTGILDCKNPPQQTIDYVTFFFKNKIGIDNLIIDTSCETYITQNMTIEDLNKYVQKGLSVVFFDNKNDAEKYNNKNSEINKLINQRNIQENILKKISNSSSAMENINKINNKIREYESLQGEPYIPSNLMFGEKRNNKSKE